MHLTHAKTPEGGDPVFRDQRFFRAEGKINIRNDKDEGFVFFVKGEHPLFPLQQFCNTNRNMQKTNRRVPLLGTVSLFTAYVRSRLRTKQKTKYETVDIV